MQTNTSALLVALSENSSSIFTVLICRKYTSLQKSTWPLCCYNRKDINRIRSDFTGDAYKVFELKFYETVQLHLYVRY